MVPCNPPLILWRHDNLKHDGTPFLSHPLSHPSTAHSLETRGGVWICVGPVSAVSPICEKGS